ncbi:Arginine/ornithine antiporter ArcD2 [Lactococcus lactis]|nr:Arginine/ornithine antiporter ArcD2 [Lactococcus lactis]
MFLVDRGVETAALVNAVVMIAKLIPLVVFLNFTELSYLRLISLLTFFWQTFTSNLAADGSVKDFVARNDCKWTLSQIKGSLMVMVWVFVGIEGAAMMEMREKEIR